MIKMAFIYKITNDVNGKVYIGKTNYSIEKRFKEHCRDAIRERCEKRPLYSAMRKYGFEHFHIEQLEEVSLDDASERERYWIEYYKSFHNGYNATMGGDGKNYVDYDELVDLYNDGYTIKEIKRITGRDTLTISKAVQNSGVTHEEIKEKGYKNKLRPVAKIDSNTNKVINVYESAATAERYNGNTRHILQSCSGRRKTCKGYKWEFIQISDPVHDDDE